ncbi:MAG: isoleucine--tRNA ligase, partial [Deltaproteobacteria bacterium]|nr:isoleucine--tRNA ligase [Deltaproteobacteria bacterium]
VWQVLPGHKEESVFLTDLPSPETAWNDEKLAGKWDRLLSVRAVVTKALEIAREQGKIGNSLEARISVFSKEKSLQELLTQKSSLLAELFIVSQAVAAGSPKEIQFTLLVEHQEGDLTVSAGAAEGQKCPRCWIYSSAVGSASDLCTRCSQVMAQIRGQE